MSASIKESGAAIAPMNEAPVQRTAKGLNYDKWYAEVQDLFYGLTPEKQKLAAAANEKFLSGVYGATRNPASAGATMAKGVSPASVHVDTLMSGFSVMYANDEYIGERCMPPVPVTKRSDKFATYPKRERLAFPDDVIGNRASPNELNETRSTSNYSVTDYGYRNFLDLETAVNEDAPLNEMLDVLEAINEGIAFRREKRISTIVVTSGNYAGNTGAITSTNWNDSTGGTIIGDIQTAISSLWRGASPTKLVGVCPIGVWNSGIFNNPALAERFKYTAGGATLTQQVATFFGLDELLIGRARQDTANEGQTASYSRIWSTDVFAVLGVALRPSTRSLHFGSTFRMAGDPYTSEYPDPAIGKRGGIWAKVSVSEDHKVVAGDAGYLVTGVLT